MTRFAFLARFVCAFPLLACGSTSATPAEAPPSPSGPPDAAVVYEPVPQPPLPAGANPVAKSGTRLKARWWATEDGALVFRDLYDTMLSTACTFRLAEDGKTRCVPDVPGWLGPVTVSYSGSVCELPFVEGSLTTPRSVNPAGVCVKPSFVVTPFRPPVGATPTCPEGLSVFASGGVGTNRTGEYYAPRTTAVGPLCVLSAQEGPGREIVSLRAVEPERLVAAAEVVREQRGALGLAFDRSEDGALAQRDSYTGGTQGTCRVTLPTNEATPTAGRCVPEADLVLAAVDVDYADEACTRPIVRHTVTACSPEAPRWLGLNRPAAGGHTCDIVRTRHDRQEPLATGAPRFRLVDGGCRASTRALMGDAWVYGPAVPAEAQDRVLVKDVGAGRLRVRTLVNEQGELLRTVGFFDTAAGLPCEPHAFEGGVRCLPPLWNGFEETRSDPACRKRVIRPRWPSESCLVREPRFVLELQESKCPAPPRAKILELTRPVKIDSRHGPAPYANPDAGTCVETKDSPTPETFFEVREYELTDFPALQEITK